MLVVARHLRLCAALVAPSVLALVLAASARAEDPAPEPSPPVEEPAARAIDDVVADLKAKEDPVRLAAAEEAALVEDDAVASPLVKLLRDDRFEIRAAAIAALAVRTTEKGRKSAASGLVARLGPLSKKAETEGELLLVVRALHDLALESSMSALLDDIDQDTSTEVIRERVMAVANVPSKKAVDELIQYLSRVGRGNWQGAKRHVIQALCYATGEDLGGDPDRWRAWWHDAEKTFDVPAAAERRASERDKRDAREEKRKDRKDRGDR